MNKPARQFETKTKFVVLVALVGLPCSHIFTAPRCHAAMLGPMAVGPATEHVPQDEYAQVVYVTASQDKRENSQGTKENPHRSIGEALRRIEPASAEHAVAVFVAAGTYAGETLHLRAHVDLFGGFDDADWSRNLHENTTVITLKGQGPVILAADDARIDGFVISGANSTNHGGAVLCTQTTPQITNNWIVGNRTIYPVSTVAQGAIHQKGHGGGAICCLGASPTIRHNWIAENSTEFGNGGAIGCFSHSAPLIKNNMFFANVSGVSDPQTRSSNGGAIACCESSSPQICGNVFLANHARGRGDGGAVYGEYSGTPQIEKNLFLWNSAEDDGAACYFMAAIRPVLRNNLFVGNRYGGTVRLSKGGAADVFGNTFVGNLAGGIVTVNSSLISQNNIICENMGSGISGNQSVVTSRNDTVGWQSHYGIYLENGTTRVINAMLVENAGGQFKQGAGSFWVEHSLVVGARNENKSGVEAIEFGEHVDPYYRQRIAEEVIIDRAPNFRADAWTTRISLAGFNAETVSTRVRLTTAAANPSAWVGRPVRVAKKWTVVQACSANMLSLWGDLRNQFLGAAEAECYFPRTYRLVPGSAGIGQGTVSGAPDRDIDGDARPQSRLLGGKVDIGADEAVTETPTAKDQSILVTFDTDPGWESFRSRLLPDQRPTVRQDFGYVTSNFAGGEGAGEAGGIVHRAHSRAYYAKVIETKTLNDRLSAKGKFAVTEADGASGALIGWFHQEKSQGWRTPSSLAFRIDGNGGKYWLFYEYGTNLWGTNGGGAFLGERYQTTPTPPYKADGTVHDWELTYDPDGAGGKGLMTFRCDNETWELPAFPGHRQQGAEFNRFGIWNQQTSGNSLRVYLDDLEIDGQAEPIDDDPGWIREGNPAEYRQRVIRPFHDFGYSATNVAGSQKGEIGGIIFRDEQPAYYADRVGPLTLDDELFASGKAVLRSAGADSGVLLGWFGGEAKRNKTTAEHEQRQTDLLGIMIEGPSRIGHFFRPAYSTSRGEGDAPTYEGTPEQRPLMQPDGKVHTWSLHYQPEEAEGRGRITMTLDGKSHHLDLAEGHRAQNAAFDRFGLFDIQSGGHHVEFYVDDLSYTK